MVARMLYSRRLAIAAALLAATALPAAAQPDAAAETVALRGAPAMVDGLWCGAGLLAGFTLEIAQQVHDFQARLIRKNRVRQITGHLEGARLITDPQRDHTMELEAVGDVLRITDGTGKLALARGQSFIRAGGGSCSH